MSIFLLVSAFIALTLIVSAEFIDKALEAQDMINVLFALSFAIILTHLVIIESEIGLI